MSPQKPKPLAPEGMRKELAAYHSDQLSEHTFKLLAANRLRRGHKNATPAKAAILAVGGNSQERRAESGVILFLHARYTESCWAGCDRRETAPMQSSRARLVRSLRRAASQGSTVIAA